MRPLPDVLRSPLTRLPRPALPPLTLTSVAVLLLLLLPSLALWRWPRPRAQGLEQLMAAASLLQSFPASPERPVPPLWRERLGDALAYRLWREQRRFWWQFWGSHADGGAYLAVPVISSEDRRGPNPANALRVGNLLVVAPDPLSRRLLQDQLRPEQRAGRGLYSACLPRLEKGQGVFWNATALAVLVGPVAPLLEAYQEGCLSLALDGDGVRWQGEAAARAGGPGVAGPPPGREDEDPLPAPLPVDVLLELKGSSLEQLFGGLLSRQLIRDPLAARYGIDSKGLALLRRSPFRLRLQPHPSGPFQASLELQVAVGRERQAWRGLLVGLARSLQGQGLKDGSGAGAPAASAASQAQSATWRRQDDGVVLGGWRWITEPGPSPQLLLFLGPVPSRRPPMEPSGDPALAAGELRLRVRPQALDLLGLLPEQMPDLVRRSDQLWMNAAPLPEGNATEQVSRLRGRLRLNR
ncbi:MAG: hypothetical protein ER33_04390 [Cyanobium sp. CACIAM 14]|nr:MAG: hypothetical protein ER33_04390 [Cyanobium sp. CACIAM 14]